MLLSSKGIFKRKGQNMAELPKAGRLLLACSVFALSTSCGPTPSPTGAFALYGAVKAAATELKITANEAAEAGDQVAKNRIEQGVAELKLLEPRIKNILDHGEKAANETVDNATGEFVEILSTLRHDSSTIGSYATIRLNATLALASQVIDDIPGLSVDPIILAINPVRIQPDDANRTVRVYGFLPGEIGDNITVKLGDRTITNLKRSIGNSISFTIPNDIMKGEGQKLPLTIEIVRRKGFLGFFRDAVQLTEELHVGRREPYSCLVTEFAVNPSYLSTVTADKAADFEANTQGGNNRPNESRKILASDLFFATVSNDVKSYNLDTVIVENLGKSLSFHGGSCGRGASGNAEIADRGASVTMALRAPYFDRTVHSYRRHGIPRIRVCDQGGSKASLRLLPTFKVAKFSSPYLAQSNQFRVNLGYGGISRPLATPNDGDWSLHVKCSYQDSAEKWQGRTVVLTGKDQAGLARGVATKVSNGNLIIEPADPYQLSKEL